MSNLRRILSTFPALMGDAQSMRRYIIGSQLLLVGVSAALFGVACEDEPVPDPVKKEPAATSADEVAMAGALAGIPAGRVGQPEEVAAMALFLVSDEASYMTGSTVTVAGGGVML